MNREIVALREVITKLVPMLVGKGLIVTQRGSQAFVEADPVTKKPKRVNIPNIPDNASEDFIAAVQGFIDHECGHVIITDWDWIGGYKLKPSDLDKNEVKRLITLHNIVEDTMIERGMMERFPGSRKNIAVMRDYFIKKITIPAMEKAADEKEKMKYLMVPIMRALAGHREFQAYMDENKFWDIPSVDWLVKSIPADVKTKLLKCKTTKETYEITKVIESILYPKIDPPKITAITPNQGSSAGGSIVEIEGENFIDMKRVCVVNGQEAEIIAHNSSKKLTVRLPAHPAGPADIGVDTMHGSADARSMFEFVDPEQEPSEGGGSGESDDKSEEKSDNDNKEDKNKSDESSEEGEASDTADEDGDKSDDDEAGDDDEEKEADGESQEDDEADGDDESDASENEGEKADNEEQSEDDSSSEDGDNEDQQQTEEGGAEDDADGSDDDEGDKSESDEEVPPDDGEDGSSDEDGDQSDQEAEGDQEPSDGDSDENAEDSSGQSDNGNSQESGSEKEDGSDQEAGESNSGVVIQTDDHEAGELGEGEDSEANGGIGNGLGKSMFDLEDDFFEKADVSSQITVLIQNEAVDALGENDYNVFSREFDRIEPLNIKGRVPDEWVPRLEDQTRQMVGKMQKDIERMLASQSHVVKVPGFRSGRLHSPNLHRILTNDDRIFNRRQEHKSKDTAVTLLIDNSGSMVAQRKIVTAMVAGYALLTTLEKVSIPAEMLGFTTGAVGGEGSQKYMKELNDELRNASLKGYSYHRVTPIVMPIYKSFDERVDSTVKKRIAWMANAQQGMLANVDGESLEYAAIRLVKRREKRKVIFVLSDGQPSGGSNVAPHLKQTVEKLEKIGIDLVGIGIKDASVRRFYTNHVVLNDVAELPAQVMDELKKILSK